MSSLLPNHHRSTSDRLLNNYLSSQKQLTTALLTLLSHSHSSTSSLLAYVTSSSGVAYPIRRSVQNAAFEGPLADSGDDYGSVNGSVMGEGSEAKWGEYITSLERFRKDLKEVHSMEEELSQVKKDREILVSRLIKATKSRPTKADIAAAAKASSYGGSDSGRNRTSNASVLSFGSDHSGTTAGGRSKRAEKLAEAQAEVLGCEEHLRGLEVRLEEERNKVMRHGLLERFRAMEDVGRMWQRQARLGIQELEQGHQGNHHEPMLHPNAYEVESNGSLAPSQSASQIGYNSDQEIERQHRSPHRSQRHARAAAMPGSVTGSIAEEEEQSSGSEDERGLVVHENIRPGVAPLGGTGPSRSQSTIVPAQSRGPAVQGVPSITKIQAKPQVQRRGSGSSGSSAGRGPNGRRTQSEIGYNPPRNRQNRMSLRRTHSGRAQSDSSSVRSFSQGKKKGGFFKSIAKLFKSNKSSSRNGSVVNSPARRGGADSPPLRQRTGGAGWSTRTDANIKRVSSGTGTARPSSRRAGGRNADYSSSDEELGGPGFVAVTNRGNNTWSVDNVGKAPVTAAQKTVKKSRSDVGVSTKARPISQTTITPSTSKTVSKPPGVVRSNTSGSINSTTRTRHGSITRVGARGSTMGAPPSIASVLEGGIVKKAPASTASKAKAAVPSVPSLPSMEIPKAPKSQVSPQMFTVSAPPPMKAPLLQSPPPAPVTDTLVPKKASSTASKATITPRTKAPSSVPVAPASAPAISAKTQSGLSDLGLGAPIGMSLPNASEDSIAVRSHTPLPPSKTLSPPARSSMRPTSPSPHPPSSPLYEIPPPAFIIQAPGSVIKEQPVVAATETPIETKEDVFTAVEPPKQPQQERPTTPVTLNDTDSVYESAVEDEGASDNEARHEVPVEIKAPVVRGYGVENDDASSIASDSTAGPATKYKVVENNEGLVARIKQAGGSVPPPVDSSAGTSEVTEKTRANTVAAAQSTAPVVKPVVKDEPVPKAAPSATGSTVERRKSVRMNVPPSPSPATPIGNPLETAPRANGNAPTASGWTSRVGKTVDSSDEDDNAAYAKARRSLNRYSNLSASSPAKKKVKKTTTTTKKA